MDLKGDQTKLKERIFSGTCVAYLGAGISIPPGKDWTDTVEAIARKCGVPLRKKALPETIDACIKKSEKLCNEELKRLFPKHTVKMRTALQHVLSLPFKAVLTTNFDPWIRMHCNGRGYQSKGIYPHLPLHEGIIKGVVNLHGHFDSESSASTIRSLVFGEKSFRWAYQGSLLRGFLLSLLTYETIVFIGADPMEPHLQTLLANSERVRKEIGQWAKDANVGEGHFALWAAPTRDTDKRFEESITELRSSGITPIFFERKRADFVGLEELLSEWVTEWNARRRKDPFDTAWQPSR